MKFIPRKKLPNGQKDHRLFKQYNICEYKLTEKLYCFDIFLNKYEKAERSFLFTNYEKRKKNYVD